MKADHAVAGLPIEPHGDGGDALGGVLHQRDLAGVGVDQPGGGDAQAVVDGQPLGVVEAALVQAIVGQVLQGVGATPGQRRDGRVIQVDQVLPDRELICISLPKREFRHRTFYNFTTHSLYNTLIMP